MTPTTASLYTNEENREETVYADVHRINLIQIKISTIFFLLFR